MAGCQEDASRAPHDVEEWADYCESNHPVPHVMIMITEYGDKSPDRAISSPGCDMIHARI
jgi:hypothetical protein